MADSLNNADDHASQSTLDPRLVPDIPDFARLSLTELEMLSSFHLAVAKAGLNSINQPRCTRRLMGIVEDQSERAWHWVNAIADEATSRIPRDPDDRRIRAQIMLQGLLRCEDLERVVLRLADEIRGPGVTAQ